MSKINSFKSKKKIKVNGKDYVIYSLTEAEKNGLKDISKLPKSLKVLLENLLRYEDNSTVDKIQINAIQNACILVGKSNIVKMNTSLKSCN